MKLDGLKPRSGFQLVPAASLLGSNVYIGLPDVHVSNYFLSSEKDCDRKHQLAKFHRSFLPYCQYLLIDI